MESLTYDTVASIAKLSIRRDLYHDLHSQEIRLITLLKGQWSDEIRCQLYHAALANKPIYKALSYAWGSPRVTRPISLEGVQHRVTFNLEGALRRLRRTDGDITLWVDALSINQADNLERTTQVKLMHKIYSLAKEVVVFLGEPSTSLSIPTSPHLFTTTTTFYDDERDRDNLRVFKERSETKLPFRHIKGSSRKDHAFHVMCFIRSLPNNPDVGPLSANKAELQCSSDSPYQRDIFECLRQMMLCRWWNRIWVVQEVVVPQAINVVYGSTIVPWSMLVAAANWHSRNQQTLPFPQEYQVVLSHFSRSVLDVEYMRDLWQKETPSTLLPLLRQFSRRNASDDRDKVFALLSLAREHTGMVPDYTLDVSTVFQNTVFDSINKSKSLAVLAGELGRKERRDLPSWVPDWSATTYESDHRRASTVQYYHASGMKCHVYVNGSIDDPLSGFHDYLRRTRGYYDRKNDTEDLIPKVNEFIEATGWIKHLPDTSHRRLDAETCLAALQTYYTACGFAAAVEDYGGGRIGVAGVEVDKILHVGMVPVSEEEVLTIVRLDWMKLACEQFFDHKYDKTSDGLGDAFRRTICADLIAESRGPFDASKHDDIARWFCQEPGFQDLDISEYVWNVIFGDLGSPELYQGSRSLSVTIDAAIRSAALRRSFFTTESGYIGLGPQKMQPGDLLYILLGSQNPFILRKSPGITDTERKAYTVVGDCYAHGLMDGEIMTKWWETHHDLKVDLAWEAKHWRAQQQNSSRDELVQWEAQMDGYEMPRIGGEEWDIARAGFQTYSLLEWIQKHPKDVPIDIQWDMEHSPRLYDGARLRMEMIRRDIEHCEREQDRLSMAMRDTRLRTSSTHIVLI